MDSNYKRETIIYIIFLIFLLFMLFGLPIYLIDKFLPKNTKSPTETLTNILMLLKKFLKISIIVLFSSIFIILIFV